MFNLLELTWKSSVGPEAANLLNTSHQFSERPMLNSPYKYRTRHWELDKDRQCSTTSRDAKDGDVPRITCEPGQVKAFRHTLQDGTHACAGRLYGLIHTNASALSGEIGCGICGHEPGARGALE